MSVSCLAMAQRKGREDPASQIVSAYSEDDKVLKNLSKFILCSIYQTLFTTHGAAFLPTVDFLS